MKNLVMIALMSVFLISCRAVGPNYSRPIIEPPDTFRGISTEVPSGETASLADLKWFELFKDEALQDLIETALVRNYDVRDAAARIEAARAQAGVTHSDKYPTIGTGATITTDDLAQRRTFGNAMLSLLSFEVDMWGKLRRADEASQALLLASEENRKAVVMTLVSDIASSYFNLLELDLELAVARRTLATREESLQLIRNRERSGVATILEVRQGEQLVHAAERSIPALEQQIEQTENRISLLMGRSPGYIPRGRLLTQQEQPVSVPAGLPSALLERRPDILAAEHALVAANATIGVAKAAYYPRISLTGFLGSQSGDLSNLFSGPAGIWQFVPQASQTLFSGGRLRSNVELAGAQTDLALIQYERTVQTAFREVSDALIQHEKTREVRERQESLVATLQDRSRLSYLRYRGGVDTLLNALDADRDLFDAELGLAQTRRDELLTLVQLYRALGGGWEQ